MSLLDYARTKIKFDGVVQYHGYNYVSNTSVAAPETVEKIWREIERAGFFQLDDEYRMTSSHIPSTIITVRANGAKKEVLNEWVGSRSDVTYPNGVDIAQHEALDALALKIEELAGTRGLVQSPPNRR